MRAHYLQHVPFEGLGSIQAWLNSTGYSVSTTAMYEPSTVFPDIDDIDLLIVLGGTMSAHDEENYPWLIAEKYFIKRYIDEGKPLLGICLGAQLIASVMGARVYTNPNKELGWFPIYSVRSSEKVFNTFEFPPEMEVFHWHGETYDLPEGAIHLAKSAACDHQAFQLYNHVIGLQFHLETTPQAAKMLIKNCRSELANGQFIQKESKLLEVQPNKYKSINALMNKVLNYLHNMAHQ